jgi:hypothetical protein
MNNHLTEEQVTRCVLGDGTVLEEEHLRECAQCQAELASFRNALAEYRTSVVGWAERQTGASPNLTQLHAAPQRLHRRTLRWIPVAAAIAVLTLIPVYRNSVERQREAQALEDARLDAELLKRVNAHLSQTAPASLQRLMEMPTTPTTTAGEQK